MTKTKQNQHTWALICGSMSPISAKQRTPGGNGTGSHEPTCMVSGVRPGFEALHGSRLISEPTNLTPLSASTHLTNLQGSTGRLQVIQEEDHTSPGWKQVAQHNGFFGWPAGLPIFNSRLLLAVTAAHSTLAQTEGPFFYRTDFLTQVLISWNFPGASCGNFCARADATMLSHLQFQILRPELLSTTDSLMGECVQHDCRPCQDSMLTCGKFRR